MHSRTTCHVLYVLIVWFTFLSLFAGNKKNQYQCLYHIFYVKIE